MSEIASPVFGAIMAVLGAVMAAYRGMKKTETRQWLAYSIGMIAFTAIVFLNPGNLFNNSDDALKVLISIGIGFLIIAFLVDAKGTRKR